MLLEDLTNLNGVSGNEDSIRDYIKNKIENLCDEIKIDKVGNLYGFKKGKNSKISVMICAHMDEVGFVVSGIGDLGCVKFKNIGGIDHRILPGKRVLIGEQKVCGVIGIKAIHQQEPSERSATLPLKKLFIDIGSSTKDETEGNIEIGDYIYFDSQYKEFGKDFVKAKALDDRVGCAIIIEMLKEDYDFNLCACFTVQEEVGLRGAQVATHNINPDICFVIEGTTCSDVPNCDEKDFSTRIGRGPALTFMDRTCITDKKILKFIEMVAKTNKIKVQYKETTTGGNDAGKIQSSGSGVKVAAISVPVRYIHSPTSVMKKQDYNETKKLVKAVLKTIEKDGLKNI